MSVYIVNKRHIDFLVAVILRSEAVPEAGVDADHIGQVLWRENHKSVNAEWGERFRTPRYRYEPIELPAGDVAYLLKQVACYQYQSCEHAGWERSDAYTWTQRLREMWEANLRADWHDYRDSPAYQAAPWGISSRYVAPSAEA